MGVNVTTRSYSNFRDGCNSEETGLTALTVQQKGISLLGQVALPNDARGTEGQVLVVTGLTMDDGLVHDVFFVATMYNDVLAYDVNTFELLWKQHVANPIPGTQAMDTWEINDRWGILATPVINTATNTIYVCAMSSPDGLFTDSSFHLHALSLTNGSEQAPALNLNAATYQAPGLTRVSVLGGVARKQRCALLGDFGRNGIDTVFVMNGSFLESADTNQGWCIACDVTGLSSGSAPTIAASWTTTSRYSGAGLWQGSQGPSMDTDGYLYAMTGNGAFDGITDFGECIFKLKYTPAAAGVEASITIVDWFSPFSDTGRVAGTEYQTLADLSLLPADYQASDPGSSSMDGSDDSDLGSAAPLFLPMSLTGYSKDVIMGSGKDGWLYVLDASDMGKTMPADFAADAIAGNYAKLLSPPYGFSYYPAGIDLMPTDLSTIPTTYPLGPNGYTHHVHGTPVFYKSPRFGCMIFVGGENSPVRAFAFNADFTLTYLGCGTDIASEECGPPGGMPGSMLSLSCNGTVEDTAVLWALQPLNDANKTISAGRLIAYGADWIDNGTLVKIWDSMEWNIQWKHCKFSIATCANGRLFVPTYDARVLIFG